MKATIISSLIIIFLFIQTAFAAKTGPDTNVQKYQSSEQKVQFLYILSGMHASLVGINKKQALYKLTIENVSPNMIYFANRPSRVTGRIATKTFLQEWGQGNNNFVQDPPNIALRGESGQDKVTYILELSQPNYVQNTHTLSFNAKLLYPNGKYIKQNFRNVSLFIDFHWHGGLP